MVHILQRDDTNELVIANDRQGWTLGLLHAHEGVLEHLAFIDHSARVVHDVGNAAVLLSPGDGRDQSAAS